MTGRVSSAALIMTTRGVRVSARNRRRPPRRRLARGTQARRPRARPEAFQAPLRGGERDRSSRRQAHSTSRPRRHARRAKSRLQLPPPQRKKHAHRAPLAARQRRLLRLLRKRRGLRRRRRGVPNAQPPLVLRLARRGSDAPAPALATHGARRQRQLRRRDAARKLCKVLRKRCLCTLRQVWHGQHSLLHLL